MMNQTITLRPESFTESGQFFHLVRNGALTEIVEAFNPKGEKDEEALKSEIL